MPISRAGVLAAILPLVQGRFEFTMNRPNALLNLFPSGIVSPNRDGECPTPPGSPCKMGSPALFGIPKYGVPITGTLFYATDGVDVDGCQPLNRSQPNWPRVHPIVMVDRGACTFVTKVRNAQLAGAIAVVVVDNVNEAREPFMADDGTADDVTTPSILIDLPDGEAIKGFLRNTSSFGNVQVTLTYSLPNPDNHVEWDFFTSPGEAASLEFKTVFPNAVKALGDHASMTPYFKVETWDFCQLPSQPCGDQCTNSGRYCTTDTPNGVQGKAVLAESVRQVCIYQTLASNGKPALAWWNYVLTFEQVCAQGPQTFNEACSAGIMRNISDINEAAVTSCIAVAGGVVGDVANRILDAQVLAIQQKGVFTFPSVFINDSPYRGTLNCPAPIRNSLCGVLNGICDGYMPGTAPAPCNTSDGCTMGTVKDACNVCGGDGQWDACHVCWSPKNPAFNKTCADCRGIPWGPNTNCPKSQYLKTPVIIGVVVGASAVVAICVFIYMKRQQSQLRDDIDQLLNRYLPLSADSAQADGTGLLGASDGIQ